MGNIQLEIELFGCLKRHAYVDTYNASNMYHIKEGLGTREINVLSNGEYLKQAKSDLKKKDNFFAIPRK